MISYCVFWLSPQKLSKDVQESLAKANDVAMETFSSMKTVRSFANEDGETERYRKRLEETYSLNKKEAAAYAVSTWTNSVRWLCVLFANVCRYTCSTCLPKHVSILSELLV